MSEQEISISTEQNTDWISTEQNTDWMKTIEKTLEEARNAKTADASDEVCIHRVPHTLRDVNPSAFDPLFISIGPYHRRKKRFGHMDMNKWDCFHEILNRKKQEASLYFNSIAEVEVVEKAKRCYEGNNLCINEFVETMVLDGCFLLEILFGFSKGAENFEKMGYSRNDRVYSKYGPIEVIKEDMLKLENQLPLFILVRLLRLISNEEEDKTDLVTQRVLELFELEMKPEEFISCSHCLHIYRCGLLRQFQPPPAPVGFNARICGLAGGRSFAGGRIKAHRPSTHQQMTKHSASELREAGVKFKKGETHCFLDIKYQDGVLCIPQLVLDRKIKTLIYNLIAFEQTYHGRDNHLEITSYALFMNDLIHTLADVAYLHDLGIIDPDGSNDDAVDFFNQIAYGVIFGKEGDAYLGEVTKGLLKEINDYHNSRIRKWLVGTKRKYFSNPWSIISLIAAIVVLVLAFLQAFYGMYGYHRPRN